MPCNNEAGIFVQGGTSASRPTEKLNKIHRPLNLHSLPGISAESVSGDQSAGQVLRTTCAHSHAVRESASGHRLQSTADNSIILSLPGHDASGLPIRSL